MRIVAEKRNSKNEVFEILVEIESPKGFVYRIGEDFRFKDFNVYSIVARGEWDEPTIKLSPQTIERISRLRIYDESDDD